jgi:predicted transcriptional regulator of viral defense system
MTAVEVLGLLKKFDVPLIETRDVAEILRISKDSAAKYLEGLRHRNFVEKISRGKWIVKDAKFDPLQVAEFITAPRETYISLHTALFYHGMIEQIPSRTYAVTIDRSKVVVTPLGTFSFHHCNPEFFVGYNFIKPYLKLATPEKALVDYFYFGPSKTRQFSKLPELEIPKTFSWKKARDFCQMIPSIRTRTLVKMKINDLLTKTFISS